MIFDHPEFDGHERVLHVRDRKAGLRAIIAIHRARGLTAVGGVRFRPYPDEAAAVTDVLRLSRAMTHKAVLAELPLGGAKSVILGEPRRDKSPELLRSFGRIVEGLGGAYFCGPDVGTTPEDMDVISTATRHVGATTTQMGSSAPPTALGVFHAIRALARHLFGRPELDGMHVAIQGAGGVGRALARHVVEAGGRATVADVDTRAVRALAADLPVEIVEPAEVLSLPADILAPCALGGVLDARSIPELRVRGICGGANNQLATEADGERIRERGITLVPDFVASAGGIIAGTAAAGLYPIDEMESKLAGIHDRTLTILDTAEAEGLTPHAVAVRTARARLEEEERPGHRTSR